MLYRKNRMNNINKYCILVSLTLLIILGISCAKATKEVSLNKPVYMIIEIQIKNEELYSEYVEKVPEIVKEYGGRYLARGGKIIPLSGNWNPERMVVLEFETMEQLQKCFNSPEYLELAPLREQSTIGKAIVVDGYLPCANLHTGPDVW